MIGDKDSAVQGAVEEAWDVFKTVGIAVGITLFVRFFFLQPFNIPSASMEPTLMTGDFILVDKIDYGYSKASLIFPLTRLPMSGRLFSDAPDRGDVAVFKNPKDRNKDYIKRIVGVPGDTIQVIGGILHVNGTPVERELLDTKENTCGSYAPNARRYQETLPDGPTYVVQECAGNAGGADNTAPITVPTGYYFGMGDNRDNSVDSRYSANVGLISHENLVGKARRVAFSVDGGRAQIWQIWKWPVAIRYSRIGDKVR